MNNAATQQALTPRQFAVLRHVWSLNDEEKKLLDCFYLLKIRAEVLAQKLDDYAETTKIAIRDHVKVGNWYVQLEWLNTGFLEVDALTESGRGDTMFVISVRVNYANGFSVGLVRKASSTDTLDAISELE